MSRSKFGFKISTTILFLFFVLVGIIATATISLQYYFSKQLAINATQNTVKYISDKTLNEINSINSFSYETLSLLELSSSMKDRPKKDIEHGMLRKFVTTMTNKNYIYALYTGYNNGDFYEVINLNIDEKLRVKYKSAKIERWLVVKILRDNNKSVKIEEYLDANLNILRSVTKETDYNPTKRPWYLSAINSTSMIKTAPYMFSNLESMGVTYAKKHEISNTVVSIDISLASLSKFLKSQEIFIGTELYIFNKKNQKIIASNNEIFEDSNKLKEKLNNLIDNNIKDLITNNKKYFVSSINQKSKYSSDEYVVMILPEDEIMKPYNEKILFSIYASIILLLIILPMIWYASNIIINPIKALEKQNDKIRNRQYDNVKPVRSRIREINDLSNSMVSMAQSIKNFETAQMKLMDSFIEVIASAIDAKSPYSAGHGQRVPIITMMLAHKASESNIGVFEDFSIKDEEEERELKIAALLHDCGKITTPEYVVDKATKLETIYNRIHEVRARFEIVHRDLEISYYQKIINGEDKDTVKIWLESEQQSLQEYFVFIANCNIGGEFMKDEDIDRIKEVSAISWIKKFDETLGLSQAERDRLTPEDDNELEYVLSDKYNHIVKRTRCFQEDYEKDGFKVNVPEHLYNLGEVYNLTVRRGTLTPEERFKINEHIIMTIKMLDQLPFPKHLKRIPEYAGAHHETLIGTGYPKKLKKEDMSIPARIMAIADIFEALTAADRPYKAPKKLSESIKILSFMVKDQHIDKDIFELFLTSGVYKEYGEKFLKPDQRDVVDISKYLS